MLLSLGALISLEIGQRLAAISPPKNWQAPQPTARTAAVRGMTEGIARYVAMGSGKSSDLWHEGAVNVSGMALQAKGEIYRMRVAYGGGKVWETELAVPGAAEDAGAYAVFTRELLRHAKVKAPTAATPGAAHRSPLVMLAFPRVEILQAENARISQWLQAAPLNPAAHEEAALLLATMAWREAAGLFRDPTALCQRAAVHLALVQALRPGALSEIGATAELFAGLAQPGTADDAERLQKLAARAVHAPELNPWISVAELARGGDWHPAALAGNPTLLEQIAVFRAICDKEGTAAACTHLVSHEFEDVADWTRILMEHDFGNLEGRRFCKFGLPFEQEEAVRVFPELASEPIQSAAWAKVLNAESGGEISGDAPEAARVTVIDPGLWAEFLQRHLCHTICRTGDHLRATAAIPEAAPAFYFSMAAIYRHLKLMPLAAVGSGERAWLKTAAPAVATLVQQHPDWVSEAIWTRFMRQGPQEITRGLPSVAQWNGHAPR